MLKTLILSLVASFSSYGAVLYQDNFDKPTSDTTRGWTPFVVGASSASVSTTNDGDHGQYLTFNITSIQNIVEFTSGIFGTATFTPPDKYAIITGLIRPNNIGTIGKVGFFFGSNSVAYAEGGGGYIDLKNTALDVWIPFTITFDPSKASFVNAKISLWIEGPFGGWAAGTSPSFSIDNLKFVSAVPENSTVIYIAISAIFYLLQKYSRTRRCS